MREWIIFPPTSPLGWCVVVAEIALAAGMPVLLAWMMSAVRGRSSVAVRAALLGVSVAVFVILQKALRGGHVSFDAFDCLTFGVPSGFLVGSAVGVTLVFVRTRAGKFTAAVALCECGLACGVVALSVLGRVLLP